MADDAEVGVARFQWEDGLARLERLPRDAGFRDRRRLVDACMDELRRRLGMTFTVAALTDEYRQASSWFLPLASATVPKNPDAWDPATAMDAAFALFARQATDAGRSW